MFRESRGIQVKRNQISAIKNKSKVNLNPGSRRVKVRYAIQVRKLELYFQVILKYFVTLLVILLNPQSLGKTRWQNDLTLPLQSSFADNLSEGSDIVRNEMTMQSLRFY